LTFAHPPRSRTTAWLALLLGTMAAAVLAAGALAPAAHADANPNDYDCRGHIEAGVQDPIDTDTQVKYVFACNGPITGFQIQPQLGDTGFDTDVIVLDSKGSPVTTDAFSCAGDFPGWGINCTGRYTGPWTNVIGQFTIGTKLCAEPRVDPLLTVTYASVDSKGAVTQAISGPYDLGRPHGCPASAASGKTRIPKDGVLPIGGDTKAVAKKKTVKRTKARAKKARTQRA